MGTILKITGDLINTVWKNKDVVEVEHAVDVTLLVIASRNEFLVTHQNSIDSLECHWCSGLWAQDDWQADMVLPRDMRCHSMMFYAS